ncbi:type II toxin-antitoxin system Phd/YefM family antitoxin [Mycoplana sp. MJR14]|uniref:type II toxin-antitoxin system Phd/YefM family antitoxin n=1 Tax=Mycoplana sp. MJR14 TaxID=3032583 RepID=UPI000DD6258B|nr:type II toxin-antitoxin system Phd/YefM family antitoxin [Mycoplana sp. MJR14]MDF1633522.1 type II toxin-antitoxin system Phd/YefM family antitoxin [Mycoplana sp. MJR14]
MTKSVAATEFKATCLRLIDEMNADGEPVVITRHGKPVAVLSPAVPAEGKSVFGALKGSVLRYDDPFAPAADADDWAAAR